MTIFMWCSEFLSFLLIIQTYSHRTCAVQRRNWIWKAVSVCVGVEILTAVQINTSTKTPASAFAMCCRRRRALRATSSTRIPANAPAARRVRGTSLSTGQSAPVNVTSLQTNAS